MIAAVGALERQALPGTVGLAHAPPAWDGAIRRRYGAAAAGAAPSIERVLVPSFAQGGANCALVFERADAH